MQLRFLAAAGPDPTRRQLDRKLRGGRSSGVLRLIERDHLSIWTESPTPLLRDDSGRALAVGVVFDRVTGKQLRRLPDTAALPELMVKDCWGAYVLFVWKRGAHEVLRDPSGSIPVYHGAAAGLDLYASDGAMLRLGWPQPFQPNLRAARQWLTLSFLRTRTTGAFGVNELLPGRLRRVSQSGACEKQIWSPDFFARRPLPIGGLADAAELLRDEVLRAVRLLAGGESVTLRLSGGLDSSIVAAALAHARVDFRAFTFATSSADGDERRFARSVADRFGIHLGELNEADLDFSFEAATDFLRRPPNALLQPLRHAFASAAAACPGAGLLFDGAGGDNVFAALNTAAPVVDAFRSGSVREGVATLGNLASLHGCTFWDAAKAAARRWRRGNVTAWPIDRSFLQASAADERLDVHPWLDSARDVAPGSADHIRMIAGTHHFLEDPKPGGPVNLHPLLAQPIIELCLRIPSWFWFAGGRDRAVARRAFRGLLPDAILDRRTKGTLESMVLKGYMTKRSELRRLLVSGRLVEEGIVDPVPVSAYLDRKEQPRDAGYIRILEIASAEQWLRSFGSSAGLTAP